MLIQVIYRFPNRVNHSCHLLSMGLTAPQQARRLFLLYVEREAASMEKSGGTIMTPTARDVWGGRTEEFVFDEVAQHLRPRVGFCIRTLDVVSVGVSANPSALWRRSPT